MLSLCYNLRTLLKCKPPSIIPFFQFSAQSLPPDHFLSGWDIPSGSSEQLHLLARLYHDGVCWLLTFPHKRRAQGSYWTLTWGTSRSTQPFVCNSGLITGARVHRLGEGNWEGLHLCGYREAIMPASHAGWRPSNVPALCSLFTSSKFLPIYIVRLKTSLVTQKESLVTL